MKKRRREEKDWKDKKEEQEAQAKEVRMMVEGEAREVEGERWCTKR